MIAGAFLVMCPGCEEPGTPKVQVTGSVTFQGKPLEGAIVSFTPKAGGPPASGTTDADGKYILSTESHGDGAVVGEYAVTIAKYDRKEPAVPPAEEKKVDSDEPIDITDEYAAGYNEMDASEKAASVARNLLPHKYSIPEMTPFVAQVTDDTDSNVFDFDVVK